MRTPRSRPDYPTPPYIHGDLKSRDQVLSLVGSFTHLERQLFNLLCSIWEPEIPYTTAQGRADREQAKLSAVLPALMEKLRNGRLGLVLTSVQGETLTPKAILLTAPASPVFYAKLVEEELQRVLAEPKRPLPGSASFSTLGISIPRSVTRPLSMDDLAMLTIQDPPADYFVAETPSPRTGSLYVPSTRPGLLIPVLLRKLRSHLDNTGVLAHLAKLGNTTLSIIERRIAAPDASGWTSIVDLLLRHKGPIEQGPIRVAPDLFVAAEVLQRYIGARRDLAQKLQLSEEQTATLAMQIEEAVKRAAGRTLSVEEFHGLLLSHVPESGPEAEYLRSSLRKRLTKPPGEKKLSRLVVLTDAVVHRDNLYLLLLQRISILADAIRKEYIRDMQQVLQASDRDRYVFFFSFENWEYDIARRVAARDPLAAELMESPVLVAEAVVHTVRRTLYVTDPREIQRNLEVLFEPGGITPRPWSHLLSLDLNGIFEVAHSRLSVLKQFMMRFSGRTDMLRRRFEQTVAEAGRPGRGYGRSRIADALDQLERGAAEESLQRTAYSPAAADHDQPAAPAATGFPDGVADGEGQDERSDPRWGGLGPRKRKSGGEPVRRPYSKKRQEDAWREFKENLRKSNSG